MLALASRPAAERWRPPLADDGVQILALRGREVVTVYVPHPRGPVFMTLLERLFGTEATTRTWDTVRKCVGA